MIGPKLRQLAASESIDNLLSGEIDEIIKVPSMVYLAINSENATEVIYSFLVGNNAVTVNARASAKNTTPIWPDDFIVSDAALPGDRLTVQIRNTDAVNTNNVFYAVRIEPISTR